VRLFVAVDVPGSVKGAIERDVVDPLRDQVDGARWTSPEGRHLTLKFLGEVPDEVVVDVASVIGPAVATHRTFEARFEKVGGFPNLGRPRVLWVGIGLGKEELASLALAVDQSLEPHGFAREDRPFHPHFTLARFQTPRPVRDLPPICVPQTPFTVEEVTLFRSQLHPKGARYTALERMPLKK
jgi:2'-5' RNA ligase